MVEKKINRLTLSPEEKVFLIEYGKKRTPGKITFEECQKLVPELAKLRADGVERKTELVIKSVRYYSSSGLHRKDLAIAANLPSASELVAAYQEQVANFIANKTRRLIKKLFSHLQQGGQGLQNLKKGNAELRKENDDLKVLLRANAAVRDASENYSNLLKKRPELKKFL